MTNPEAEVRVSPENLFPQEIADRANHLWKKRWSGEKPGGVISKRVAVALIMQEEGRDTVKRLLEAGKIIVPEDTGNYVSHDIDSKDLNQFTSGLGAIMLGSIVQSLEESFLEGWSAELLVVNINQALSGTHLREITVNEVTTRDNVVGKEELEKMETKRVRELLPKDKTFRAFLKPPRNFNLLPSAARNVFLKFEGPISMVVPVYEQAIDQPGIKNSQ